jgi:3-oxoacid CoA-transferase
VDKVFDSPAAAVADIADGSSVAIAGFGVTHRFPSSLITALRDQGARRLTVYCNGLGVPGQPTAQLLAENGQLAKLVASFSSRPGPVTISEEQILAGELEFEIVPQGTLVERMRAGGAGIAAFFTPAGAGTLVGEGKEVRDFDGRPHLLEHGIRTDYALLRAWRADRMGNVQFRGASRNFNDSFAKAARVAIIEVDEIVEVGEIAPQDIDLPGVFVARVVVGTVHIDVGNLPRRAARSAQSGRLYADKPGLTREEIGHRVAMLVEPGSIINLGAGLPNLVANFLGGRNVVLHGENGVLKYGGFATNGERDPDHHDAGGNFITLEPGASFFDSVTSFEMARGGRINTVILGAYEVDQDGSVANWSTADAKRGGIGGAMDLLSGKGDLIIVMEHVDSKGRPKLRRKCTYPLTGKACVSYVVTDLALLRWDGTRFVLDAVAPGFTPKEVIALTEMQVAVAPNVRTME